MARSKRRGAGAAPAPAPAPASEAPPAASAAAAAHPADDEFESLAAFLKKKDYGPLVRYPDADTYFRARVELNRVRGCGRRRFNSECVLKRREQPRGMGAGCNCKLQSLVY